MASTGSYLIGKKIRIAGLDDQYEIILSEDGKWRARVTRHYGMHLLHEHRWHTNKYANERPGFWLNRVHTPKIRATAEEEFDAYYDPRRWCPTPGDCHCQPPKQVAKMFKVLKLKDM